MNVLAKHIFNRIKGNVNRSWTLWLLVIEVYNLIHAAFAIYLTDVFLGGHGSFVSLTLATAPEVFPTMTKCKFHKYGPSGSIQVHDALCVLAINIVNEKFFYILHWWMPFVLLMCVLCLLWRFLCLILYRNPKERVVIGQNSLYSTINFWDWVFLTYLASNMSGLAFRGFFSSLADCIRNDVGTDDDVSSNDGKPLLYNSVESERIKDE
ncbi:hypothetical protein B566_EDAN001865 [Ephemera danica]|nr:hypothetical protein B566_EDAN001865 [Ephemera danica]